MSLVRVAIGVRAGGAPRHPALSLFDLHAGAAARRLLRAADGHGLGHRASFIGAFLLRQGLGAESLAWLAVFLLAPASAVYYPVSVLPHWLQLVAWALPSAHVFEGMRTVMFEHRFALDHFRRGGGSRPRLSRGRHRGVPLRLRSLRAGAARCCSRGSRPGARVGFVLRISCRRLVPRAPPGPVGFVLPKRKSAFRTLARRGCRDPRNWLCFVKSTCSPGPARRTQYILHLRTNSQGFYEPRPARR